MSIANLLASMCEPQYPCMFLVHNQASLDDTGESQERPNSISPNPPLGSATEGSDEEVDAKIGGAVGTAYGNINKIRNDKKALVSDNRVQE